MRPKLGGRRIGGRSEARAPEFPGRGIPLGVVIFLAVLAGQSAGSSDTALDPAGASVRQECFPDLGAPLPGPLPKDLQVGNRWPGIVNNSMTSTGETTGTLTVTLVVQDLNSWLDVYAVLVTLSYKAEPQACGLFRHGTNASDLQSPGYFFEDLLDVKGRFDTRLSFADRVRDDPNNPDAVDTHLRVSFVFTKVAANIVTIQSWDRRLAGTVLEFETDPSLRPTVKNIPQIPWTTAGIAAAVSTFGVFMMRSRSNQIARIAERRAGRARAVLTGGPR
jgi:hypothetical protein